MYKFAINRPVTVLMGVLALIFFGMMSYRTMPVNLFPNVEFPIITIQTQYPGADPETVESKVTDKIEEAISGIDEIDKISSSSYDGLSVVMVQFELGKDISEAANDVRDKIGALALPIEVEKPVVQKVSASAGSVINLFIADKAGDEQALMKFADEKVKPLLQRLKGVGEVTVLGFRDRQVRIFADPFLLNKYGLDAYDLERAIAQNNVRQGGGKLVAKQTEVTIKSRGDAQSIEEIKDIIIKPGVRLKDIATVEDGLSDAESYSQLNETQGVMLEVKKITGANTLEIIDGVKKVIPKLEQLAGEKYRLQLLQDQSVKIWNNLDNVTFDLIFGSILAVVIVFVFLRNLTATIVASLAIPTSIIGTFAAVDFLGFDLNKLTMIGLTLAIGIFIDDAIVVIENISKKLESGMKAFEASYEGVRQIAFSVLAISAMLLAVFIPVGFMGGIVGQFFNAFAITVAAGVVISYLVAIMLIPTLSARLLSAKQGWLYDKTEPLFRGLDKSYVFLIRPIVKHKIITILMTVGILVGLGTLLKSIGGEFVPMQDESEFKVMIKAKEGTSLEEMKRLIAPMQEALANDPLVEYTVSSIGYTTAKEKHKARIYAKLVPVDKRGESQEAVVQRYRETFSKYKDMIISVEDVPPFDTGENTAQVQIFLTGPDMKVLEETSKKVKALLADTKGAVDIDSDLESGKPELKVTIERENAQRLGVSVEAIAAMLNSAFSSERAISYFDENGKQYDVTVRFGDQYRKTEETIDTLRIKAKDGSYVPLEGLISIEESTGPSSVNRYNRERDILVTSNVYGAPLDAIVKNVTEGMPSLLQEGYDYVFAGDIERMQETAENFMMAVMLIVILIYLILAALYESLIQPFIIMVALPLSFTGVVLSLYITGMPFSIFVLIGIILLLGMVGKNAVLVVDFANQAVKRGAAIDDALAEAGEKRLRPILMTTFAMIFAMLPLALNNGVGHEMNNPMATAVIGGLISSTLLTLLVVPALYRLMYPLDAWLRKFYERERIE